jgi:predicted nucleotidyltransferase
MGTRTVVDLLRDYCAGRREVTAAYLFGSVARGDAHAGSDVDVGVLLAPGFLRTLTDYQPVFTIQSELEQLFRRKVDVVAMNDAPLDLLHRIMRDGIVVLDRDPRRRAEFELNVRTQYFDWLPILRRYRRAVLGAE